MQDKLDALDGKIIALFERRMAMVKAASANDKRQLAEQRKRRGAHAADKTVRYACDGEVIAYTEELVMLMLRAAYRYEKKLIARKRRKVARQ